MKKRILVGILVCMVLLSNGCSTKKKANENINTNTIEENPEERDKESISAEPIDEHDKTESMEYSIIREKINLCLEEFSKMYENAVTGNTEGESSIEIHTGEMDIPSTEGNEVNQYIDEKGEILRYSIMVFGEMGNVTYEYHKLDDNTTYATILKVMYSAPIYMQDENTVSKETLEEYIVVDNKICCLDSKKEILVEVSEEEDSLPFANFEELNAGFIEIKE
ncbi:hypothetical protein [Anaerosporobacter sp.]|uniref:hypothetical protein n=1 Tax=Anaerosporobacter sp. TaxID=1872529 RepID=UPI00286EE2B9|nr:hypothetical protein [Anaerosporobacter sp.]